MKEDILINKAKKGDKKSLEKLLYNNYKIVYGYLIKLCLDEDIAKDITQETMLKAIKNIKKFNGRSKFSTWLISIASNKYKDDIKKKKNTDFLNINDNIVSSINDVKTPEKIFLDKEDFSIVKKALLLLPYEKRKVFILKHYYSYSYEEISNILNCPLGTVRSRLHYCIKKLREVMEGDYE
ncbi:MAG: RNA polymerase sigma factor SigY [Clostridiales bacterium]